RQELGQRRRSEDGELTLSVGHHAPAPRGRQRACGNAPEPLRGVPVHFLPNSPYRCGARHASSSGFMVFWILAIVVTAAACGTLYHAAVRQPVNAAADAATNAHFRLQLKELDGHLAGGRLGPAEAQAARGEIAREVLRLQQEQAGQGGASDRQRQGLLLAIAATVIIAFAGYAALGQPGLPAQPLAARTAPAPE